MFPYHETRRTIGNASADADAAGQTPEEAVGTNDQEMPPSADMDALLDRLLESTQSLRDSARTHAAEHAADLLARRQQLVSLLRSDIQATGLTEQQRDKLNKALYLGDEARQALLIRRETSRRELQETLAGRRLNESFKPYQPKKFGGLNVKL